MNFVEELIASGIAEQKRQYAEKEEDRIAVVERFWQNRRVFDIYEVYTCETCGKKHSQYIGKMLERYNEKKKLTEFVRLTVARAAFYSVNLEEQAEYYAVANKTSKRCINCCDYEQYKEEIKLPGVK